MKEEWQVANGGECQDADENNQESRGVRSFRLAIQNRHAVILIDGGAR